jgi:hypothetical protein
MLDVPVGGGRADEVPPPPRFGPLPVAPVCLGKETAHLLVVGVRHDEPLEPVTRFSGVAVLQICLGAP